MLLELGAAYDNWWNVNLKPNVPNTVQLIDVDITDLGPAGRATQTFTPTVARIGTQASAALPNNVAACISLKTDYRGRSFRGRIYHVGLTEIDVTGDQILAAKVTALETAYTALKSITVPTVGTIYTLGVLSYYANKAIRGVPVYTPVTAVLCDTWVDSQRRRLTGRGS